jgi:hypothetical protein
MTEEEFYLLNPHLKPLTPEEQADKDIEHMRHSIGAIFSAVADCKHSREEHDIIDRNVAHLELMLAKEHVANHSSDKSAFHSAIAAGKEHLA